MLMRRSFLQGMAALFIAPAIVRAESLNANQGICTACTRLVSQWMAPT